jgi:hypothetical protein
MQRGTRNVDISRGMHTTSRESDRNLMAPVCADSFLTAQGSTVVEVIALMVGGSKYRCSRAVSVFVNHEFVFHLNT